MENHVMVAEQKCKEYEKGPGERDKMEAQIRIPQRRSDTHVEVGGRMEGLDKAYDTMPVPQGGCDDQPA